MAILPDFVIDARGARFSELLQFTDSSRLDGVETLVDIKGLGIDESLDYVSFRAEQGQLKPIDRRAVKVHKAYCSQGRQGPRQQSCGSCSTAGSRIPGLLAARQ